MHDSIGVEDIDAIAQGAAVLGAGGGGDPHIGSIVARRLVGKHGPVPLVSVDDLDDDTLVAPVGMIGAPAAAVEKILSEGELSRVLDVWAAASGARPAALMPIEVGGGNSMVPIACAAVAGLPLVDADAMGRAFPESQMVTFYLHGYDAGTAALVDALGNSVVVDGADAVWSERLARAVTTEMGANATMVDNVQPGAVVRACAIRGTLTLAHRIGTVLTTPDLHDDERLEQLLGVTGGRALFEAKVTDVHRSSTDGFTRGSAQFLGTGDDRGRSFSLEFQNEMVVAREDGEPLAMVPDLICVLDAVTSRAVTTESIRYGARVRVVAIPCDAQWRTPRGIEVAGPRAFGLDLDYRPFDEMGMGA